MQEVWAFFELSRVRLRPRGQEPWLGERLADGNMGGFSGSEGMYGPQEHPGPPCLREHMPDRHLVEQVAAGVRHLMTAVDLGHLTGCLDRIVEADRRASLTDVVRRVMEVLLPPSSP
jgi:hypothetical protein